MISYSQRKKRKRLNMVAAHAANVLDPSLPSSNEHALMASDHDDSKFYLPEYNPKDYAKWSLEFTVAMTENVGLILSGDLEESNDEEENKLFLKYNKILFQKLFQAVGKRKDSAGLATISGPNQTFVHSRDGIKAWNALQLFHNKPTMQNKLLAINQLIGCKQEPKENALQFTLKVQEALAHAKNLNLTLDEIAVAVYMNGFLPKYRTNLEAISVSDTKMEIEKIYDVVSQYELRLDAAQKSDAASALAANDNSEDISDRRPKKFKKKSKIRKEFAKSAADDVTDNSTLASAIMKYISEQANFASTSATSNTASAASKTCYYCKAPGHIAANCFKKKKADAANGGSSKYGPKQNARLAKEDSVTSSRESCFIAMEDPLCSPCHDSVASNFACSAVDSANASTTLMKFYADSGASSHMINASQAHLLVGSTSSTCNITTAGGRLNAVASGSLPVPVAAGEPTLAVSGLYNNLYSIPRATAGGRVAVLTAGKFCLYDPAQVTVRGKAVLEGLRVGNMYEVNLSVPTATPDADITPPESALLADVVPDNSALLWHQRLNHCSNATLKRMNKLSNGKLFSARDFKLFNKKLCPGCALGKMKMLPITRRPAAHDPSAEELKPGELIMLDLLVSPVLSTGGSSYALVILDCATKKSWVKFLQQKNDVVSKLREWLGDVRADGIKPTAFTTLRSDNGGEFSSSDFLDLCRSEGLKLQHSAPYTHVHGVERVIQTLQNSARCNLINSNMPKRFWAEALAYSTYVYNSLPAAGSTKSKHEKWSAVKPDLRQLRTFGSLVYAREYDVTRSKWDDRAFRGRFLGYCDRSPGSYRVWKPDSQLAVTTRNVVFDEQVSPDPGAAELSPLDDAFLTPIGDIKPQPDPEYLSIPGLTTPADSQPAVPSSVPRSSSQSSSPFLTAENAPGLAATDKKRKLVEEYMNMSNRISSRTRSKHAGSPPTSASVPSHVPSSTSEHGLYADVRVRTAAELRLPQSYKAAMNSPEAAHWKEAVQAEVQSLIDNDVIEVMEYDLMMDVLDLKWVFTVKETIDGVIARWKARCTARGDLMKKGVNYGETFAPVVRFETLRFLLAYAAAHNWPVHQMDVVTAFLYGLMEGPDVYVKLPPGYPIPPHLRHLPPEKLMGKLKKALYGIKQAPRLWNDTIDKFMLEHGFTRSNTDACLYWRDTALSSGGVDRLFVGIFVDDIVITGSSLAAINMFKEQLSAAYSMKDMGELRYCLGMEVTTLPNGQRKISQRKYVKDMLVRFGLQNAHAEPTPMDHNLKLTAQVERLSPEVWVKSQKFPYREIVGSLMYLMICTRPDICYAVTTLSRYLNCHGPMHHAAALRVLRYVKGTRKLGIIYSRKDPAASPAQSEVYGYSDSDHAANVDDRRSITGYVFFYAGGPITWKTKTQPRTALSSTEAEYMALAAASCEAMSLRYLQEDFGIPPTLPTLIHEDNSGAIAMSINPVHYKQTKHIHYRFHFIRECVDFGDVRIQYINTKEMIADALTKALAKVTFLNLRKPLLGGEPPEGDSDDDE